MIKFSLLHVQRYREYIYEIPVLKYIERLAIMRMYLSLNTNILGY